MTKPRFVTVDGPEPAALALAEHITNQLANHPSVLWLVSGGSSIAVAAAASQHIRPSDAASLAIAMIDERYGPPGHDDSNWRQLMKAGLDTTGIETYPMLMANLPIDEITLQYEAILEELIHKYVYRTALFGIGADGHTAGLLPGNPLMNSDKLVGYYDSPPYKRITTTPRFIDQINDKFVYTLGANKWPALRKLVEAGPPDATPARVLLQTGTTTIFSDYKKEER